MATRTGFISWKMAPLWRERERERRANNNGSGGTRAWCTRRFFPFYIDGGRRQAVCFPLAILCIVRHPIPLLHSATALQDRNLSRLWQREAVKRVSDERLQSSCFCWGPPLARIGGMSNDITLGNRLQLGIWTFGWLSRSDNSMEARASETE